MLDAISDRDRDVTVRKKSLVDWLNRYAVFMGFRGESRIVIAGKIIEFADARQDRSLQRDKGRILSEFNKLKGQIREITPRSTTSLTSKALWCCYPDDIPIYDRNAVYALRVISRLCRLTPTPSQDEYARFVDVWFRVYSAAESVIDTADLSECPHKVRVLDRLLWYLGENTFYGEHVAQPVPEYASTL